VSATETPWPYIHSLLGPGLHWSKSPASVQAAIDRAERDGQRAAADHLRIILERIHVVGFITPEEKTPPV
jgi:hypothetical protein